MPTSIITCMDRRLPLSALLSHALVAFTIEFDNEFEHRVPHRTTNHGAPGSASSPWLVSMVIWLKFMRFVAADGITVRELKRVTRSTDKEIRTWLTRLQKWWGYVVVEPAPQGGPSGSRSRLGLIVRTTAGGGKALETWSTLTGVIEKRWSDRFGEDIIDRMRKSLQALVDEHDGPLPDCLPILGYDLLSRCPDRDLAESAHTEASPCTLPILLSKVLLAFAVEFECESGVSLAINANVLRIVGEEGVRARDLPRLTGLSKEAVAMSLGRLEERGFIAKKSPADSRVKTIRLTARGRMAQDAYYRLTGEIENKWRARFGKDTVDCLRELLELLDGSAAAPGSPWFRGLDPYPDGWRAALPRPEVLPDYPMVLHRGAFPDGS